MSLTEPKRQILSQAGTTPSPTIRRQAVAIALAQSGTARDEAIDLLCRGFRKATQPSFHYIPKGEGMADQSAFEISYQKLAYHTGDFADVSEEHLIQALTDHPDTLAPLRMILGLTHNELSWAMKLTLENTTTSGATLKKFERSRKPERPPSRRSEMIKTIAVTAIAVMNRSVLQIPVSAIRSFHSKLDKRDTLHGWSTVAVAARGVPYSELLYQRYVGGVWRQVQDAYSEVKGDSLLKQPIADLFDSHGISYHRSGRGASGAARTEKKFGLSPGPDFVIPGESPTVVVESKVAEDGGTARDKAARIKTPRKPQGRGVYCLAPLSMARDGQNVPALSPMSSSPPRVAHTL